MECPFCGSATHSYLDRCVRCGGAAPVAPPDESAPEETGIPEDLLALRLEGGGEFLTPPAEIPRQPGMLRCDRDRVAGARRPPAPDPAGIERLATEVVVAEEQPLAWRPRHSGDAGPEFTFEEELIPPALPGLEPEEVPADVKAAHDSTETARAFAAAPLLPRPQDPVIDRDEEVPEQFWTPEGAGLGRRIAALLVDQLLVGALLGLFFGGAYGSFRLSGFDTSLFLSPRGLAAALLPFSLLAALLGLGYFTFFHGCWGRTPGKKLAGIEVRTLDGSGLSYGRALLRSLAGLIGLACAGAGLAWALFEPRRRGWADLLSGTVLGERHRSG